MKIKGLDKELAPIVIGTSSALFTDETTPWIPTNLSKEEQFAAKNGMDGSLISH